MSREGSAEKDVPLGVPGIGLCTVERCKNQARGMVSDPTHDCWYCLDHKCPNTSNGADS